MAKADCSELHLLINDMAMNLGSRADVKTLDDIAAHIRAMPGLEAITRQNVVTAITEATASKKRAESELDKKLNALKREARKEAELVGAINDLQAH